MMIGYVACNWPENNQRYTQRISSSITSITVVQLCNHGLRNSMTVRLFKLNCERYIYTRIKTSIFTCDSYRVVHINSEQSLTVIIVLDKQAWIFHEQSQFPIQKHESVIAFMCIILYKCSTYSILYLVFYSEPQIHGIHIYPCVIYSNEKKYSCCPKSQLRPKMIKSLHIIYCRFVCFSLMRRSLCVSLRERYDQKR